MLRDARKLAFNKLGIKIKKIHFKFFVFIKINERKYTFEPILFGVLDLGS